MSINWCFTFPHSPHKHLVLTNTHVCSFHHCQTLSLLFLCKLLMSPKPNPAEQLQTASSATVWLVNQVCHNTLYPYKHCNKSLKLRSSFHCCAISVTTGFFQSSAKAPHVMAACPKQPEALKSHSYSQMFWLFQIPATRSSPNELNRNINVILNAVLSLVDWLLISLTTFHPAKTQFASQIVTLNTVLANNWYKSFCINTKWRMMAKTLQC